MQDGSAAINFITHTPASRVSTAIDAKIGSRRPMDYLTLRIK